MTKQSLKDRIIKGCKVEGNDIVKDCWIWQGATSGKPEKGKTGRGYGKMSVKGHSSYVHRVMYVCFYGYIPNKIHVDHICNNRLCCNPLHLEAVTHKENMKRRDKNK